MKPYSDTFRTMTYPKDIKGEQKINNIYLFASLNWIYFTLGPFEQFFITFYGSIIAFKAEARTMEWANGAAQVGIHVWIWGKFVLSQHLLDLDLKKDSPRPDPFPHPNLKPLPPSTGAFPYFTSVSNNKYTQKKRKIMKFTRRFRSSFTQTNNIKKNNARRRTYNSRERKRQERIHCY